jgi:3-methyl-2-oxobutanoate hydroxymethyltransferase
MQTGSAFPCSSVPEALQLCNRYMEIGADCVYGGSWSTSWIRDLREAGIPINSHVGLIPAKATWIGGFRAIGKTAEEAAGVLRHTLELQEAGVIGVEMEVVPTRVAEFITKHVDIITMSMGSGSGCDGQYLFANDILGYTEGKIPRHARIYRDFKKEHARLQAERVAAFKEFHEDVVKKTFNDPKITVGIEDEEFEKFLDLADKAVRP